MKPPSMLWLPIVLALCSQSWGDDHADEATDRVYEGDEVLITGERLPGDSLPVTKLPVAIASIPASISGVSSESIDSQG